MQSNALADPSVRALLDTELWVAAAAVFGGRAQPVGEDLDGVDLSPDLVIHDAMELAGPFIAARSGFPRLPTASVRGGRPSLRRRSLLSWIPSGGTTASSPSPEVD